MDNERRIVAAAKRQPERFLELYDHYHPKLYAYILSRVRHRERAEDVVADAFLKALNNLDKFTWRKGANFGSWLFRIARNEMVNQIRREAKSSTAGAEVIEANAEPVENIETQLIANELEGEEQARIRKMLEIMKGLSDVEQEVISLKYFANMSYKEISVIIKKKPNTLAVTLRRALGKIRKELDV